MFQQGMQQYMANQGVTSFGDTDLFSVTSFLFSSDARQTKFNDAIRSVFNVAKSCKYLETTSCQYNYTGLGTSTIYTFMPGNPGPPAISYNFCTTDGMCFQMMRFSSYCNPDYTKISPMKAHCGFLFIDINGAKKPNKYGRDIFYFEVGQDGLLFPSYGIAHAKYVSGDAWESSSSYWKNKTNTSDGCGIIGSTDITGNGGASCAARIEEEGWQMNY